MKFCMARTTQMPPFCCIRTCTVCEQYMYASAIGHIISIRICISKLEGNLDIFHKHFLLFIQYIYKNEHNKKFQ